MSKIKIDFTDLEMAFVSGGQVAFFYLDTESGKIITITEEIQPLLDRVHNNYSNAETGKVDWETAFTEEDIPDWQQEELLEANQVDLDSNTHFLKIPPESSQDGYRDMVDFIETVTYARTQAFLNDAISGRSPFFNFKNALMNYPAEREHWFKFQNDRIHQRMLDWLESEEISYDDC
jgi:hypothetical protein